MGIQSSQEYAQKTNLEASNSSQEISKVFAQIRKSLLQKEQELLSQIEAKRLQKLKEIEAEKEKLERKKERMRVSLLFLDLLTKKGNQVEKAKSWKKVLERKRLLEKEKIVFSEKKELLLLRLESLNPLLLNLEKFSIV
jgi:transposase